MSDSTGSPRRKGRRATTLLVALLGVGTVALAGFVLRDAIRETWYLHQLRSPDIATRMATVEGLAEVGGNRSVDPLLEICRQAQPEPKGQLPAPVASAISALTKVVPRANASQIEKVLLSFSELAGKTTTKIELLHEAMEHLGSRDGRVMHSVCAILPNSQPPLLDLAIRGFVGAWTKDRARGEEFLLAADVAGVIRFLHREGGAPQGILWRGYLREVSKPLTGYLPGTAPRGGRALRTSSARRTPMRRYAPSPSLFFRQ